MYQLILLLYNILDHFIGFSGKRRKEKHRIGECRKKNTENAEKENV
jgi:hypothetical protein